MCAAVQQARPEPGGCARQLGGTRGAFRLEVRGELWKLTTPAEQALYEAVGLSAAAPHDVRHLFPAYRYTVAADQWRAVAHAAASRHARTAAARASSDSVVRKRQR